MPRSEDNLVVQRGETYDHAEHAEVEVTGIWRGIHEVNELTDTLPAFLEAID